MRKCIGLFLILVSNLAFAMEVKVEAKGMVCGFCAQGITKKFSADPSVERVDVNLETQVVTLTLKADQRLDDGRIHEIVKDAGFTPGPVEHIANEATDMSVQSK